MFPKIKEALAIFTSNIGLFSLIVLTIWLPGNIVSDYIKFSHPLLGDELAQIGREIRISNFIEGAFGPIYVSALIYALSQLKQGIKVNYSEAMSVGLRNWGKFFAARFWAGLVIFLGLIAFIIPGIIIAVRYALIGCVVVLEESPPRRAMARSVSLTKGKRWQIFGAVTLTYLCLFILSIIVSYLLYIPLELAGQPDNIFISVFVNCVIQIFFTFLDIVIFLFYWDARQKELADEQVRTI